MTAKLCNKHLGRYCLWTQAAQHIPGSDAGHQIWHPGPATLHSLQAAGPELSLVFPRPAGTAQKHSADVTNLPVLVLPLAARSGPQSCGTVANYQYLQRELSRVGV